MCELPPADPSAFFINLCVEGKLVPMTQGELLQFFRVHYTSRNLIPDDLPESGAEVRELLRRGQQFYEQDQDPQNEPARQCNREKCSHIPQAGVEVIPDFLYLKPVTINGLLQTGLFTAKALPIGTWIGTYTGTLLSANYSSQSLFAILLQDLAAGVALKIDAQKQGNHMRFMNHSDSPNVRPEYLFYQGMYYIAMKIISAVEAHQQLAYNYSQSYWNKLGVTPAAL